MKRRVERDEYLSTFKEKKKITKKKFDIGPQNI